jgi:nitrate reductase gamma subunit
MEPWLEWARGPAFRACFAILVLGLARAVALSIASLVSLIRRSRKNGRVVAWRAILFDSMQWALPLKKGLEQRAVFSLTSMLFHVAAIVTPVFLGAHILLWERGLGVSWPAIGNSVADLLTWIAICTGIALCVQRVASRASRALSRVQDYLLPVLILVPFVTGYLAMHPSMNPFGYNGTMFVHVMSANTIFLIAPFSKLSHMVLFLSTQAISEIGWHLAPGAGERVAAMLGKQDEPI